jgi:hypothetical protein
MKRKLVKESLNENIKFEGHEYTKFDIKGHHIFASPDGILVDHHLFVSWNDIKQIMRKFNKT